MNIYCRLQFSPALIIVADYVLLSLSSIGPPWYLPVKPVRRRLLLYYTELKNKNFITLKKFFCSLLKLEEKETAFKKRVQTETQH